VVEKYTELDLILRYAAKIGVRPKIGMRVKLASRGSGRWQSSGGYRSKFGLTVSEIMRGLEQLKQFDMADCLQLLHFHMGSQITNIRVIKNALIEAARVYTDLYKRGAGLRFLDVGGGLGIDYDGSRTNFQSSMNYSLQEYANDVVYHLQQVCDDAEVPHPEIISESGRALVAHHSVLVFGCLGVGMVGNNNHLPSSVPADYEQSLHDLLDTYNNLTVRNVQESYHDAQQTLDMAVGMFASGYLSLDQRSMAEDIYWATCRKIRNMIDELDYVPEELAALDTLLADTYFCNFSLFQSLPDSWAINQLFPIMPIHRLEERPTRNAVLGDITCDSDGKIDHFIDRRDVKRTLPLHEYDGKPYYLGTFLVGAYQETLGDLHNLFGDTHAVHVSMNDQGNAVIESVVKGDTIREVLEYVQYNETELTDRVQTSVETAVREGILTNKEAGLFLKSYAEGLAGYTYLE
jgi:arginine decarboxylase